MVYKKMGYTSLFTYAVEADSKTPGVSARSGPVYSIREWEKMRKQAVVRYPSCHPGF
jgi:hypothetical protein